MVLVKPWVFHVFLCARWVSRHLRLDLNLCLMGSRVATPGQPLFKLFPITKMDTDYIMIFYWEMMVLFEHGVPQKSDQV